MENINQQIGEAIRQLRRSRHMTLQQLADGICKSRATVSKYESGDIALDIPTLYDLARVLHAAPEQLLTQVQSPVAEVRPEPGAAGTFFGARELYIYFFDGRIGKTKEGTITIGEGLGGNRKKAFLEISVLTTAGNSSRNYYSGTVTYSDTLIRFSFQNRYNNMEEDLLYIFNPLELRDSTNGLFSGISSVNLQPCAFKCLVTLVRQEVTAEFQKTLFLTAREISRFRRQNMLMIDNAF